MLSYSTFKQIVEKYGFHARCGIRVHSLTYGTVNAPVFIVRAQNVDGRWVDWFSIVPDMGAAYDRNSLVIGDNTDVSNIWLYRTRPNLTAEDCVMFFNTLNANFQLDGDEMILLKDFIDPEDWQQLAHVKDAGADPRYTEPYWRRKE